VNINKVLLMGRMTRDPELKELKQGTFVCNFGLALNRPFKDKAGEWKNDTIFLDVECWGQLAERIGQTGNKGTEAFVEGSLKQESWEKEGTKHTKIKVSASDVKLQAKKADADSGATALAQATTANAQDEYPF
jgi:single-strand DNA-binding protein